jgi:VID27 N-terminal region/VID27 PH-like domain
MLYRNKNMISSIISGVKNMMFGDDQESVAAIKTGSLFYLDPIVGAGPVLVYSNCSLVLRKTKSEFDYEIVVNRTIEEGQQDLDLPDGIQGVDELEGCFDLVRELKVHMKQGSIIWADLNDESGCCGWTFKSDSPVDQLQAFEEQVYLSIFEHCFHKQSVQDQELVDFVTAVAEEALKAKIGEWKEPKAVSKDEAFSTPVKKVGAVKAESAKSMTFSPLSRHQNGPVPEGTTLAKVAGILSYYDSNKNDFINHFDYQLDIEIRQTGQYHFYLVIWNQTQAVIMQIIEQRMNPFYDFNAHTFTWVWFDPATDAPYCSWRITFPLEGGNQLLILDLR